MPKRAPQTIGGCVVSRLTLPERRAIDRLGFAGFIAVGDVEGPLVGEHEILAVTWLSVRKRLDEARVHSPRERGCRVSLWTDGERFRGRLEEAFRLRFAALGIAGRSNWVRLAAEDIEAEIRAAGQRAGVSVFDAEAAQQRIDAEVRRDLMRGF